MEIAIALIVFPLVIVGMAIGFIVHRKPIQGSCGGLNNLTGADSCEVCGAKAEGRCDGKPNQKLASQRRLSRGL